MPIRSYKPTTPSMRYIKRSTFEEITKTKPEKALVKIRKKTGGRNNRGRVTMRGIGGGAKQKIRNVDFKRRFSRKAFGEDATVAAKVIAIEYDPMRSARIALLEYEGGEKRYIIAPNKLGVGDSVQSGPNAEPEIGSAKKNKMTLQYIVWRCACFHIYQFVVVCCHLLSPIFIVEQR